MRIACLDVEGVLLPEIWINVAQKTGIEALKRTTRDEPDYGKLMGQRIAILRGNRLTIADIRKVISQMDPLPDARNFLDKLRSQMQVLLLSDTFEEFAQPLMEKLGWPSLLCNSLVLDTEGYLTDFVLRQVDGKKRAVEALKGLNIEVYAAGDSYNDLSMIRSADRGAFFQPPASIVEECPEIQVVKDYSGLLDFLTQGLV